MIEWKRPGADESARAGEFISGEMYPHNTVIASAQHYHRRSTVIVKRWTVNQRLEVSGVASEVRT